MKILKYIISAIVVCVLLFGGYIIYSNSRPLQQQPLDTLPRSALSDLSTVENHPELGMSYVPNELLVYGAENHDTYALIGLINSVGGVAVAYEPQSQRYIVRFPASTPYDDFVTVKNTISKSSETSVVSLQTISIPGF